jgi:hypothetical protein
MSAPLLVIVSIIYAYVAAEQCFRGNVIGSVVWLCYACANCALMLENK